MFNGAWFLTSKFLLLACEKILGKTTNNSIVFMVCFCLGTKSEIYVSWRNWKEIDVSQVFGFRISIKIIIFPLDTKCI